MISRVAESCYWLMRYVERADTMARLLRVHTGMVLDTVLPADRMWRPLLIVAGQESDFEERYGAARVSDGEVVQEYLTWDDSHPASIFSAVRAARENARTVREAISLEMWNVLNSLWLWLAEDGSREMYDAERQAFYDQVNDRCHLFQGVWQNTMLHEGPFDFMRLGLNLERAGQTARILDLHHHALSGAAHVPTAAVDTVEWIAILRTRYAYEPFFKKRRTSLGGPAVTEFLLQEPSFPTAVAYAVTRAKQSLDRIRPVDSPIGLRSAELLDALRSTVVNLDVERAIDSNIHGVLTHIVDHTAELSQAITEEYFYGVMPAPVVSAPPTQVNEG
jgi:uncharacterized alpha-E superfamily protein